MKAWSKRCFYILFLLVWTEGVSAASDNLRQGAHYSYPLKTVNAQISVEGSSTLGQWDCTQSAIDGRAVFSVSLVTLREQLRALLSGGLVDAGASKEVWSQLASEVKVAIDANGFDCHSRRMQGDLMEAIQANKYPTINYTFTQVEEVPVVLQDDDGPYVELKLRGELLFGGVLRPTVHTSQLRLKGTSTIEIKGQLNLEMSEFDIKPPTAFLGLIRANDNFHVLYHLKIKTEEIVASKELPIHSKR